MKILLIAVILLSAVSAKAEEFVDPRFNLELEGHGKATADNPLYLYPQYISDQMGTNYVWIKYCRLLENKIGYLKYRCEGYDEYADCPVPAAEMKAVQAKCKTKFYDDAEIIEARIDDKPYVNEKYMVRIDTYDIHKGIVDAEAVSRVHYLIDISKLKAEQ